MYQVKGSEISVHIITNKSEPDQLPHTWEPFLFSQLASRFYSPDFLHISLRRLMYSVMGFRICASADRLFLKVAK